MRFMKKYATLFMAVLAVLAGSAIWGIAESLGEYTGKQGQQSTYVSPTQGIALTGEVENHTLNIDVKPQEELEKLTDASGKPYAQAGSLELPADATEVSVNFMRQFKNVASQITTINFGENIYSLGDAYFSEEESRYIGVFDGFTALQSVNMPNVETIGSYAFYGCMALQTATTQVETLTVNNFAIRETNASFQIIGKNVKDVTINGTWGSVNGGDDLGGVVKEDFAKLPYTTIEFITFSDAIHIPEFNIVAYEKLEVIDARNALSYDSTNIDVLTDNPVVILDFDNTTLKNEPKNTDVINNATDPQEIFAYYKHLFKSLYICVVAPESDFQYFNLEQVSTYFWEDKTASYLHFLQKNDKKEMFTDFLSYNVEATSDNYLNCFLPMVANGLKLFLDDITTLYIPKGLGNTVYNAIHGDFINQKAETIDGQRVDAFQNIDKLIISGGYTDTGVLWSSDLTGNFTTPMPNLKTLVLADGIENAYSSIIDPLSQVENVYISNTIKLIAQSEDSADAWLKSLFFAVSNNAKHYYMNEGGNSDVKISDDGTSVVSLDGKVLYAGNSYGTIPTGVEYIATAAFVNGANFPSTYTLSENVKYIAPTAIIYNQQIEKFISNDNLMYLGDMNFMQCENLRAVTLGRSLEYIGKDVFKNADASVILEEFIIHKEAPITSLPNNFFANAENLEVLQLSDNITTIGENCFTNHNLKRVHLPENLQTIGNKSFSFETTTGAVGVSKIPYIERVNIPKTIQQVGTDVFADCAFIGYLFMSGTIEENTNNVLKQHLIQVTQSTIAPISQSQFMYATTATDIEQNYIWYEGLDGIWENTTNPALIKIDETYYHRSDVFEDYTLTETDINYELTEDGTGLIITKFNSSANNKDYVRIPDRIQGTPVVEILVKSALTVNKGVKLPDTLQKIGESSFNIKYGSIFEIPAGVEQLAAGFVGHTSGGFSSFVVSPDNQHFEAIDGVLVTKGGEYVDLIALTRDLFVPEGVQRILSNVLTVVILSGNLYISKTVEKIADSKDGLFFVVSLFNILSSIEVDPENQWYTSGNGNNYVVENATKKLLLACPSTVLNEGIEIIDLNAYTGVSIDYLNMPDSVVEVFGTVSGLGNVVKHMRFSPNVENINDFKLSLTLQNGFVEFPQNSKLTELSADVFGGNTIFSSTTSMIALPGSLTSIAFHKNAYITNLLAPSLDVLNLVISQSARTTNKYLFTSSGSGNFYPVDEAKYGPRVTQSGNTIRIEQPDGSFTYYTKYTG